MATVQKEQIKVIAEYISNLEAQVQSYADDLAEAEIRIKALEAELLRIKATGVSD